MNSNTKSRIEYIDVAKGIGMLCIIAGHMGINVVNRCVYTFHIPLFLLISGYFISNRDSVGDFIKKRANTILKPYAVTCILLGIIQFLKSILTSGQVTLNEMKDTILSSLYGSGNEVNRTLFGIKPIGAIWFLLALLWAAVIVRVVLYRKYGFIIVVAIAIASVISARYVWLPLDVQAGGLAAVYVYVGAFCAKKRMTFEKMNLYVVLLGVAMLGLEFATRTGVAIDRCYSKNPTLAIWGAVVISYMVVYLAKLIAKNDVLKKYFSFVGNNSIIILSFHLVELNNLPWSDWFNMPWQIANLILIYICKLLFISICTVIVVKVPELRKLYGKS
ncbi:MAG: acyltransferase family protein [Lachnospiraceae bacterium]|nr:acyltransferase family protein [Lachnospiraceae bacterium]